MGSGSNVGLSSAVLRPSQERVGQPQSGDTQLPSTSEIAEDVHEPRSVEAARSSSAAPRSSGLSNLLKIGTSFFKKR